MSPEARGASPTLLDVARAAGVSRTTVSNAFNRPDQLSAQLRERVLAIAREVADDLLVMDRGQIVVAGAKGEVDELVVRRYLTV